MSIKEILKEIKYLGWWIIGAVFVVSAIIYGTVVLNSGIEPVNRVIKIKPYIIQYNQTDKQISISTIDKKGVEIYSSTVEATEVYRYVDNYNSAVALLYTALYECDSVTLELRNIDTIWCIRKVKYKNKEYQLCK